MPEQQLALFEKFREPPARTPTPLRQAQLAGRSRPHSGSETSRAAAAAIEPQAGTLCASVYSFIVGRGEAGATDHEIQAGLRLDGNSERPRRKALENRGLIEDSGRRRETPTGRMAIVWVQKSPAETPGCQQGNDLIESSP